MTKPPRFNTIRRHFTIRLDQDKWLHDHSAKLADQYSIEGTGTQMKKIRRNGVMSELVRRAIDLLRSNKWTLEPTTADSTMAAESEPMEEDPVIGPCHDEAVESGVKPQVYDKGLPDFIDPMEETNK